MGNGNSISRLRSMEADALKSNGEISAEEAKKIAEAATTKEERAVVADMFAHDKFEVSKKQLTDLEKMLQVDSLPKRDPLVGTSVPGVKGAFIQRTLGDSKGYESKHHAIAVARAAGLDNAIVVQDAAGKWHAAEASTAATGATGKAGNIKDVLHVGKLDQAKFKDLKAKVDNATTAADKVAAWQELASYTLGVPKNEINVIGKGDAPAAGKVNINLSPDFDPEGRVPGFDPKKPDLVELGPKAFDRPANAVATLAHEEIHASHYRETGKYYEQYKKSGSHDTFRMWAAKNIKDVAKADMIAGFEDGTLAATELFAHIEAAKVAFASGDLTQAATDLAKVRTLPVLPLLQTQNAAIKELIKLRDSLPTDARKVFNDEVLKASKGILKGL
jgi:hypothetical protein